MQDVGLASDIMLSLNEMLGKQGRSARQETMWQIYNTKMIDGTSLREHCLRMISNLNTLEVLGADIDGESQVDMILQSLPKSFMEFRLNYNMNKKSYSLSELMNELVAAEAILDTSSVDANMVEASTSQPKSKGKGKKKKKNYFNKQDGKQIVLGVANKGKCFQCGEKGYWKRNCPKFRAANNKGMKSTFLLEICLVQNPTDSWCVDSSCTNHIYNSLQGFQETRKLSEGELFLTLACGSRIPVIVVRVFNLYFDCRVLKLEDCLYVPNVHRNLISTTYLGKNGYCAIQKDNVVIKKDKVFICSGNIFDGLYILTPDKHELDNSELDNDSHVKSLNRKFPSTNDAYLWHLGLGHINSNMIQRLIKDGLLEPMDFDEFPDRKSVV